MKAHGIIVGTPKEVAWLDVTMKHVPLYGFIFRAWECQKQHLESGYILRAILLRNKESKEMVNRQLKTLTMNDCICYSM